MKIYITGVSGVGKSTLVEELRNKGVAAFDLDYVGVCHWKNKETGKKIKRTEGAGKAWLEAHDWICDIRKLKKLLEKKDKIVIAGITSNQKDFLNLFDKIILLRCKKEVFLKRLTDRKTNDFGRTESEQSHILGWYEDFEKEMLERNVLVLSSERPVSEIAQKVIKILK